MNTFAQRFRASHVRNATCLLLVVLLALALAPCIGVSAAAADHTVIAWGWNVFGQTNVPQGLTDVVQVAAGYSHNLALKRDGAVVAWGANHYGPTSVPHGLTDVVQVAAG